MVEISQINIKRAFKHFDDWFNICIADIECMYSAKYILYWILSGFTFGEKMKKYSTQMNGSKFKESYHQYKSSGLPNEEFCKI